jgi:squalene synthase HpnC
VASEVIGEAETPSGKGAGDENFPVGSFLISRRLRPHVASYYAFARAIDDIADNVELSSDEKVRRLEGFAAAIEGRETGAAYAKAHDIAARFDNLGITKRHCLDLVSAFKQDALKGRYRDWQDLMDYCNRSAAPVGRFLLDLHGESKVAYKYSDALCNALQVINHLQDCKADYLNLDRVYLPGDWMAKEAVADCELSAPAASPGLLAVIRRSVIQTAILMATARQLPRMLHSRRLAMESEVIVTIALRLCRELATRDPVAERVQLTRLQSLACGASGIASNLRARRQI